MLLLTLRKASTTTLSEKIIEPFQGQLYVGSIEHNAWANSRVPTPKASKYE
jgi:hypothetical protein